MYRGQIHDALPEESKSKSLPKEIQLDICDAIQALDLEAIKKISTSYDIRAFDISESQYEGSSALNALIAKADNIASNIADKIASEKMRGIMKTHAESKDSSESFEISSALDTCISHCLSPISMLPKIVYSNCSEQEWLKQFDQYFKEHSKNINGFCNMYIRESHEQEVIKLLKQYIQIIHSEYLVSFGKVQNMIDYFVEQGISINSYPKEFLAIP